jgi:ribosomal protein L21E
MPKINIDELTEAELVDLNHRIVGRLRFLSQMRAHKQMLGFKIGDRVTFQPEGSPQATGMLTRYNKKTVTVITDDGMHWNVSPSLLQKADSLANTDFGKSNLVPFKKK